MKQSAMMAAEELSATVQEQSQNVKRKLGSNAKQVVGFIQQAQFSGQFKPKQENDLTGSTKATKVKFIAALDPMIEMADVPTCSLCVLK